MEPSRNTSETVNQNGTFFPTTINEIDANLKVIQQILVLCILKRNCHSDELEVFTGVLERVEEFVRRESELGGGGEVGDVEFGDLFDGDGEGGTPFGEEGNGSGAENGEYVCDVVVVVNGAVLENLSSIVDVADEEILSD